MKTIKLILSAFLVVTVFLSTSCKKKIQGCMNTAATNYKSSAEEEDGSCKFEGTAMLWYNDSTSNDLLMAGFGTMTFKVDGENVGELLAYQYHVGPLNCGDSDCITVFKSLGNSSSKSFPYRVEDENGNLICSGSLNFTANICTKQEIHY